MKVTSSLTLALPLELSLLLARPFALTSSFTSPAAAAVSSSALSFFDPASCTAPGAWTITVTLAVPLRLFFFTLPNSKLLSGAPPPLVGSGLTPVTRATASLVASPGTSRVAHSVSPGPLVICRGPRLGTAGIPPSVV